MNPQAPSVYFLVGPTASGKGGTAFELGRTLPVEIVSLDSMKLYRGMDVGTAKPSRAARDAVPHHMIDVADPWEEYDLRRYVDGANRCLADILGRGRSPLVSGGTGLYLRALLYGVFEGPSANPALRQSLRSLAREKGTDHLHALLGEKDPRAAGRIHPNDLLRLVRALEVIELTGKPLSEQQAQNTVRSDVRPVLVGLRRTAEDLDARIEARVDRMMAQGFLDEVRRLWSGPRPPGRTASRALGYAQLAAHLRGETDLDEAVEQVKKETRRFSRRQMTWLRSFPELSWLEVAPSESAGKLAERAQEAFGIDRATPSP
jgi:tRNA dimethylallyltransferase